MSEITYKDFAADWPTLRARLVRASELRRDIIHSAIDWSAGQLTRTVGGIIDGQSSPLDLRRDEAFLNDLRTLFVDVAVFTQDLGHYPALRCRGPNHRDRYNDVLAWLSPAPAAKHQQKSGRENPPRRAWPYLFLQRSVSD